MRLTVIINTYNAAKLLPDALNSLVSQTDKDFALLVVDDGSTDDTDFVARSFADHFQDFRFVKKPHTLLANSRNVAMELVGSDFIALLDADDLWRPTYVAELKKAIVEHPDAELICSNGSIVTFDGRLVRDFYSSGLQPMSGELSRSEDIFPFFWNATPSATTFSLKLYQRVGRFDERYPLVCHDVDWLLRAIHAGAYCLRLEQKLVTYRVHDENLTNASDAVFESWLRVYDERKNDFPADAQFRDLARKYTRTKIPSLLTFPGRRVRPLLREAMRTFGVDAVFVSAYLGSFVGKTVFSLLRHIRRRSRVAIK